MAKIERGTCRHCGRVTECSVELWGAGSDWLDAHQDCSREARRRDRAEHDEAMARGWDFPGG